MQISPCGQFSLQSKLLSTCKHVLGLRSSVAQASLLDELGLQPLQIIWLKTCVKFFATACIASRGNPLLWEVMGANVELSKNCHKAWCARLDWILKCIGVLRCEEMDMCNPPDLNMVAQAVLHWAGVAAPTCNSAKHSCVVLSHHAAGRQVSATSIFACWVAHSTFVGAEHGSVLPQ
jgi:hypothetical protein